MMAASPPGDNPPRLPPADPDRVAHEDRKDRVVRFHYTVSEVGQEPIESSKDRGEPLAILIGHGNIIPGLENAMMDKEAGATFNVDVKAADAYGVVKVCPSACRRSTSATPSWPRASRSCCRPTSARVR